MTKQTKSVFVALIVTLLSFSVLALNQHPDSTPVVVIDQPSHRVPLLMAENIEPTTTTTSTSTTVLSMPTTEVPAHLAPAAASRSKPSGSAHRGYATARECISMVENGGDYGRSSNPSHFGRYQFDREAWVTFGGNPDTWGTASPEEQDAVFDEAMRQEAYSRWLPYDNCG